MASSWFERKVTKNKFNDSEKYVDINDIICTTDSTAATVRLIGACPLFETESDSDDSYGRSGSYNDSDFISQTQDIGSILTDRSSKYKYQQVQNSKFVRTSSCDLMMGEDSLPYNLSLCSRRLSLANDISISGIPELGTLAQEEPAPCKDITLSSDKPYANIYKEAIQSIIVQKPISFENFEPFCHEDSERIENKCRSESCLSNYQTVFINSDESFSFIDNLSKESISSSQSVGANVARNLQMPTALGNKDQSPHSLGEKYPDTNTNQTERQSQISCTKSIPNHSTHSLGVATDNLLHMNIEDIDTTGCEIHSYQNVMITNQQPDSRVSNAFKITTERDYIDTVRNTNSKGNEQTARCLRNAGSEETSLDVDDHTIQTLNGEENREYWSKSHPNQTSMRNDKYEATSILPGNIPLTVGCLSQDTLNNKKSPAADVDIVQVTDNNESHCTSLCVDQNYSNNGNTITSNPSQLLSTQDYRCNAQHTEGNPTTYTTLSQNAKRKESIEYDLPYSSPEPKPVVSYKADETINPDSSGILCGHAEEITSTSFTPNQCDNGIDNESNKPRFNPFDRDVVFEDDHFSEDNGILNRIPDETKSSSGSSFTNLSLGEIDNDVTYAELGLAEDYFSRPEGHFGMTGIEELEMAIENCRELIRDTTPHSEKHHNLVKKLVQLRYKVQELKDGDAPVSPDIRTVVGHRFRYRTSRSSKHYCEKCNNIIWGVVQPWYRCIDCGYGCHEKCLNLITRTCANLKVKEKPIYIMSLCPEKGLASQAYHCSECRLPIGYLSPYREARLCDYSGNFYCDQCHWNDQVIIPARVIHNWDFEPRKVSRASKQFLRLMRDKPILHVYQQNPMLFNFVEELVYVKKYREEFLVMKKYFLCCKKALDEKLLLMLKHRQHFVENSDVYSLKDLLDLHLNTLIPELNHIYAVFSQHITKDCQLCRVKGFICELCNSPEVLFPFDSQAVTCVKCSYVLHRSCHSHHNRCPQCDRREKRRESLA